MNRNIIESLITALYLLIAAGIALLPSFAHSTPAYKLYIYNLDRKNNYHIRLKNEGTGWQKAVDIEADSCVIIHRMEPGEYSIRTYKGGTSVGDYASFEVEDDDLCVKITSVTGGLELCDNTFCS
jgi:hypothetical protein